jgi:hypothetical protein
VLVIGLVFNSRATVIVAVILSSVFNGTNDEITTQAVMPPEPLEAEAEPVAS